MPDREIARLIIRLSAQTGEIKKGLDDAKSQVRSFASTFKTALAGIGVYLGIRELVQGMKSVVSLAIGYNSEIEQQKLGIASLISATSKITDNTGKVLEGHEKLNAALAITDDLYEKIRLKALAIGASTEAIIPGFQSMIAPGRAAGMTYEQILDVAIRIVQAMKAMRLPIIQMRVEANALLKGEENIRADIMKNLAIRGEEIKAMRAQGKLYEYLMERLAPIAIAGEKQLETWDGLKSATKEIVLLLNSMALKPIFIEAGKALKALINSLVTFKRDAKGVIIAMEIKPEVKKMIQDIANAVSTLIRFVKDATRIFMFFWNTGIGKPAIYTAVAVSIGLIATKLIQVTIAARSATAAFLALGRAAIIGGLIELGFWAGGVVSNFKEAGEIAERLRDRLKEVANISQLGANMLIQIQRQTKDLALTEDEIAEALRRGIISIQKVTKGKFNVFWKLSIDRDSLLKMREDLAKVGEDFQTDFMDKGEVVDEEMKKKIEAAYDAIIGKIKEYKAEMIGIISPLAGARAELEKMVWEKTKDVKLTPELTAKINQLREAFEKLADAKIEKELTDKLKELQLELLKLESPVEADRIAFENWLEELTKFKDTVPAISILIDQLRESFENLENAKREKEGLEIIKQGYESRKQLEENLTNVTASELNKRLSYVDTWVKEQVKLAEDEAKAELRATKDIDKSYELLEQRKTEIAEAGEKQRTEIRRKYARELNELELTRQLAIVDRMEKAYLITEAEAIKRRLALQQEYLDNLNDDYKSLIGVVGAELERQEILGKIADKESEITEILQRQKELSESVVAGLKEGIEEYLRAAKTQFELARDAFLDVVGEMKDAMADFFDYASDSFGGFGKMAKRIIHEVYMELVKLFFIEPLTKQLVTDFRDLISKIFPTTTATPTPATEEKIPGSGYTEKYAITAKDAVDETTGEIKEGFSKVDESLNKGITGILNTLVPGLGTLLSGLTSGLGDVLKGIGSGVKDILSGLGSLLSSIFKGIGSAIGLQTGGEITGPSGIDKVHIRATAGEFIHPVESVQYYGTSVMEAIRRRVIPKEIFEGLSVYFKPIPKLSFATGGMVPNVTQGNNYFDIDVDARNLMMKSVLEDRMRTVAIETIREFSR